MHIIIGSGNRRVKVDLPSIRDKIGREQAAEDLKAFLFRPATLDVRKQGAAQ